MSKIIYSNEQNFTKDVLESSQPAVVYFWAEWCGPCKMMSPNMEEFAGENNDVRVVKINVDENQALSMQYKVMSIPTLLLFKNGTVINQAVGVLGKDQLSKFVS